MFQIFAFHCAFVKGSERGWPCRYWARNCAEVTIYFVGVRISYLPDSPSKRKMSCVTLGNW